MSEEPKKVPCWFCKEPLPGRKARRCNKCNAYQKKRWLPLPSTVQMLAPAVTLLGITLASLPFVLTQWTNFEHRHSQTSIAFAGTDIRDHQKAVIYAHLWNSGRRDSTVSNYRLLLDCIDVEDVALLPIADSTHEVQSIVPGGRDFTTVLQVLGLRRLKNRPGADVELETQQVTLCADVEESDGRKRSCVESQPFQALYLSDVINVKLPKE